jgi:voltage-gated potassium channel Kch
MSDDQANLKVAITSKLLRPSLRVVCRSEVHNVGINMASFGTDDIVNPFDIFANRLGMALHSPANYIIHRWLTSPSSTSLSEPLFPPRGRWILCGYGRFGKAVEKFLTEAPHDTIIGRGTEAHTLRKARIEHAAGIIADTDDDANNLSIIMTAREINPELFIVIRQNRQHNDALFQAADVHIVMQRSDIIARTIITRITNPLLAEFLDGSGQLSSNQPARRHHRDGTYQLLAAVATNRNGHRGDVPDAAACIRRSRLSPC